MRKLLALCLIAFASPLLGIDWPAGYVMAEGSTSPDGRYAVLIPTIDAAPEEPKDIIDYLADVRAHRVLGAIQGAHYCQGENHHGLGAEWSADSSWGVVEFEGRFGFLSLTLIDFAGGNFTQTELGQHIAKATPNFSNASIYQRLSPDRKLRVRAVSTNDPKDLHRENASYSLFQGTYDLTRRRWTVEDGRKLTYDQYDALSSAYGPADDSNTTFPNTKDRLSDLDRLLNSAYTALRMLLPPERFAKIKAEQIAWLKLRDAAPSDEAKAKLVHDRVVHLQDLLW